jgi:predicted DNA-binding transcriptional regulator
MNRDKVIGGGLLALSIVVIAVYLWLVFFPPPNILVGMDRLDIFMLKLTGAVAVVAVFAIVGWIGYTLATTPPPKPIEEIEKEIEAELKKLEETKGEAEKLSGEGSSKQS